MTPNKTKPKKFYRLSVNTAGLGIKQHPFGQLSIFFTDTSIERLVFEKDKDLGGGRILLDPFDNLAPTKDEWEQMREGLEVLKNGPRSTQFEILDFRNDFPTISPQQLETEIYSSLDKLQHMLDEMRTDLGLAAAGAGAFAAGALLGATAFIGGAVLLGIAYKIFGSDIDNDGYPDKVDRQPRNPNYHCFPPLWNPDFLSGRTDTLVPLRFAPYFISDGEPVAPIAEIRVSPAMFRKFRK